MRINEAEMPADCLCVSRDHGLWQVWKKNTLCWEGEDGVSVIHRARELALSEGKGICVFSLTGKVVWRESEALVERKLSRRKTDSRGKNCSDEGATS